VKTALQIIDIFEKFLKAGMTREEAQNFTNLIVVGQLL